MSADSDKGNWLKLVNLYAVATVEKIVIFTIVT